MILTAIMLLAPVAGRCGEATQAPSSAAATEAPSLDEDALAMVKAFLKMPTAQLPAAHIPKFLAVDPAALPEKLRQPFWAKRLELYTLKQLADGKKKGGVRMPEEDCSIPKDTRSTSAGPLRRAGYEEISGLEEDYVMEQTECTEHDLMCEFTLQILAPSRGMKEGHGRRLFLHQNDPLFAMVALYRQHGRASTRFFGIGGVNCAPRSK